MRRITFISLGLLILYTIIMIIDLQTDFLAVITQFGEVTLDEPDQSLEPRKLIIAPSEAICSRNLSFIVFVHMRTDGFARRTEWRRNYGRFKEKYNFDIIYTLGLSRFTWDNQFIHNEANQFHDIMQGDFIDAYRNITHKQLMHLRYAAANCSHIPVILKIDDDLVWNVKRMDQIARNISTNLDEKEITSGRAKFWCKMWHKSIVQRKATNRWAVPRCRVKESFYPDFCSGIGYIYTPKTVTRILRAVETARWFWIDDAFITGYLRIIASIPIEDISYDFEMEMDRNDRFAAGNITFSLTERHFTNEWFSLGNREN